MITRNFENWTIELEAVWNLKTGEDCEKFADLMYSLDGNEGPSYLNKLIESVKLKEDFGVYESLYNAIWAFPPTLVAQTLAKRLPEFQKRMGKYDQVFRFYIPVSNNDELLNAFLEEAKQWTAAERRTSISALKNWSIEDEEWEKVLEKLGKPAAKINEEPIPEHWDERWKIRLEEARKKEGEYSISSLFWKKGKKEWLEDLDFLLEVLALNQGKNWRQVDTMTNALWFFAHKIAYPTFVEKLRLLPNEKQVKILDNIKRVNKRKFKQLNEEINGG
ncbi:hypothetical protein [Pedobacter caeni]|uniref:Uncharacterized protein n=1 Tax=Pedobacter caeni TaxID=288992 RepID=A0A1M4V8U0_9SPHI|nr:hypothetical protein [Pedobacter caeni]SHE65300.1 hypothetical protein SAMN04488522_101818 [Pedobacter caeni]